jgi:tight adherence protein C
MELLELAISDPAGFIDQYPQVLALVLIFVAAVLIVLSAAYLIGTPSAARERLKAGSPEPSFVAGTEGAASLQFGNEVKGWQRFFAPLYKPFLPRDEEKLGELRKQMIQAGRYHPQAAIRYYASRIVLAGIFCVAAILVGPAILPGLPPNGYAIGAAMALVAGYLLPAVLLDHRIARRKRSIREGFPDALDMLLVCMEAGLGLDAAIARVGSEIQTAHPVISEHFKLVGNELRAGRSRHEALRNLAERTGVEEVRTLVTLLVQSDELGTSVAQALRVHASEMRAARILRAEELAHKVPVKLAFPLMFGFIPVVVLVTVMPAVLKMMDFIFPILKSSPLSEVQ